MRLEKKVLRCDKLYHLYFKPIDIQNLDFNAGQYLAVIVGENIKRFYSIASTPGSELIELLVATAPGGPGSIFFENVKEGDVVDVMGPIGVFTYKSTGNAVFVSTGTGIAPFHSMIKDQLAKGNTNQMQLLFGVRSEEHLFLQQELETLASKYPNFKPLITLSQPSETWAGAKGRVTNYLQEMTYDQNTDFYLCGIKAMIMDAKQILLSKGVPAEKIFTEMY